MPKIENIISSIKDKTFFDKCYSHFFMKTYKIYALFFKNKKIKKNKIVFCNFYGRGYGDNPKYIAEYILNNNLDYELVWIIDKNKCKNGDSLPDKIRKTKYKSFSSVKELSTAGIWIDNCRKDYFPSKKENQIYIQTWHGTFITKKIEADANLPAFYIKMAKKDSKEIDFLLSSNKKRTEQFKRCFWYDGPIIETGCPRDDILFQEDAKKNIKNKICRFYGIPSDKKILLYVPTFRNSHNLEPYNIDYKNILLAIEKRFGGNWQIITRLHPGMIVFSDKLHLPDFVINATLYNDMQELLCASDVIITDYSSMGDYSLYLKPLFMFCVDIEDYKKERGLEEDLETLPFPIAQNNDELLNNILHFDIEKYNKDLLTYYNDEGFSEYGHACQKVMKLIENKHGNESNEKSNKNNTSPLISVIIPVYNVELYLRECVDSVLNQTYTNLEVILVDDGSPDNCPAICDEYAAKDNRVRVIHKENGGLSDARNVGINEATGKYVLFLDSDDYLYSDTVLEEISHSINKAGYPNICYLPNEYWSSNPKSINLKLKDETISLARFLYRVTNNYYLHTAGQQFVLKLDYIKKYNLQFRDGFLHEDELWFAQILINAKTVHVCPCVFYFYVDNRSGSIINSIKEKNISDKLFIADEIIKISNSLPGNLRKLFITRSAQIISGILQSETAMKIIENNNLLKEKLKFSEHLLFKSKKLKHKVLYFFAKIKGF